MAVNFNDRYMGPAPDAAEDDDLPSQPENAAPKKAARTRVERLDSFAARIGQAAPRTPQMAPATADDKAPLPPLRLRADAIRLPQRRHNASALKFSLRLCDIIIITAIIISTIWTGYVGTGNHDVLAPLVVGVMGMVIYGGALFLSNAHQFHPAESFRAHMKKVFFAAFSALGLWLATALILKPSTFLPDALAIAGVFAAAALFALHSIYYAQIRRMHERKALTPTIIMLGATESARRIIEENARSRDLNILAIFDDRLSRAPKDIHGVPVVGKVDDLFAWKGLPYIDRIVVTLPGMAEARKKALAEQVRKLPNRIAFVVDEFETLDHVRQRISQIAKVSLKDLTGDPKSGGHTALKRLMDVVISSAALVLGAPILALIALLIRLDSPGPVIFKQTRHGFNNREFDVYKFRSLRADAEDKQAAQQVISGDSRVTKIGQFIRKTSLDELPQLINVLRGEMSLVGPRPHAVGMRTGNIESYKLVEAYAHRHKVKPGMTGWAQINGSRGPLHDAASVARRVRLDVEYIERASIWLDFYIMIMTLPCLVGDRENVR